MGARTRSTRRNEGDDMTDTRQALAALYKVVIARNRDGVDWGEHFGPLMTALADTKAALSAQPVAGAVATEPSEEIQELRAQVEAWRKQCETLTNQVICCGVAARHPDATLTTRGAYAGKWNSPQAEEVRKLRAERDALLAAAPQPAPSVCGLTECKNRTKCDRCKAWDSMGI